MARRTCTRACIQSQMSEFVNEGFGAYEEDSFGAFTGIEEEYTLSYFSTPHASTLEPHPAAGELSLVARIDSEVSPTKIDVKKTVPSFQDSCLFEQSLEVFDALHTYCISHSLSLFPLSSTFDSNRSSKSRSRDKLVPEDFARSLISTPLTSSQPLLDHQVFVRPLRLPRWCAKSN